MSPTRTAERHVADRLVTTPHRPTPRRVSLPDRIALRVGLALVVWSRRTRRVRPERSHDEYRRLALQLAEERRRAEQRLTEARMFWR
ncbi:hypothetical protein [Curtobacterium sp. Leaf261]|uniref:hypothetical protein n=1 Tax=Curtobacterium sp. Leaf261 TaxID=1736311 RepID=UPI0006FD4AE2|nr:hypothetical protein [Curtobacterium sp. Leaf261]KQO64860.1 hypothetical protein ASF23_01370 [Curtobacterium sp. Leaf261]